ncbi:hypothetical protein [Pedobacter gandavensis]|uniref:hypothetical protein n=1 Tax=Pedobacter gandavensis TaxID=2679963 RepID=UPI00292F0718|nr:hypothetical protein [Pedobacter gandavensis]
MKAASTNLSKQLSLIEYPSEGELLLKMPAIRTNEDQEVFEVIVRALAKSYTDLGMAQPPQKDKDYLANELTDLIPRHFPFIRLQEIPLAFSRGIRGKYGPFYGLNVVTFEKFIEAHLQHEVREQLMRAAGFIKQYEVPDRISRFRVAKQNAMDAMRLVDAGKEVLSGGIVYDFLDGLGLISFSNAEKWEFMKEAKCDLTESLERESNRMVSRVKRMEIDRNLLGIKEGTAIERIKASAKKLALNAFLRGCRLEGANLEQLIEEKESAFI